MTDAIAQLKAELTDLNMKCQLARDNEVRFALQRGRLEAERTNLLVKMIEALAPTVAAPSAVVPASAYSVTLSALTRPHGREVPLTIPVTLRQPPARSAGKQKRNPKPKNLPSTKEMIFAVLQSGDWMRPNQITQAIRDRYWKDAPRTAVPSVVWRMAQGGRLEKGAHRGYRRPVVHAAGSATGNGVAVA